MVPRVLDTAFPLRVSRQLDEKRASRSLAPSYDRTPRRRRSIANALPAWAASPASPPAGRAGPHESSQPESSLGSSQGRAGGSEQRMAAPLPRQPPYSAVPCAGGARNPAQADNERRDSRRRRATGDTAPASLANASPKPRAVEPPTATATAAAQERGGQRWR